MSGPWAAGGLERLRATMEGHVARSDLPGLAYLVERDGVREVVTIGTAAFGDLRPLPQDALFRLASLAKPIIAAAALRLVDRGSIRLDDPVARWLPELAAPRVLRRVEGELGDTVPAERPITVEHLLTSRFGFGIVLAPPRTHPIQRVEADLGLRTLGPPWPPSHLTSDEWMARLATLPLLHQPGAGWAYNTSITVLGVLLERVTGSPLDGALRCLLLDDLGMCDTRSVVDGDDVARFTTAYVPMPGGGAAVLDRGADSWWSDPRAFPNAAGWLVSTLGDVGAFAAMIANGGVHDGRRILSLDVVRAMTTDHLDDGTRAAARLFLDDDGGWGYGLRVPAAGRDPASEESIPGGIGWDGGTGTSWRWRPRERLTGVLLTQLAMTSPVPPPIFVDFWRGALAAVSDR